MRLADFVRRLGLWVEYVGAVQSFEGTAVSGVLADVTGNHYTVLDIGLKDGTGFFEELREDPVVLGYWLRIHEGGKFLRAWDGSRTAQWCLLCLSVHGGQKGGIGNKRIIHTNETRGTCKI